jgi:hypothetical protein
MPRAPRVILTVCLATVFFSGRHALGQQGPRTTEVASGYTLVSFAYQPLSIPVAGADLDDLTAKARVCLSMLNTLVRRYKKRPLTGTAAPATIRANARICADDESKEIKFQTRS